MNIRIRFEKTGTMKFVGHLDVMRYFQKAFKRAGIDMAYSEGYSPHQIMSFAAPLGIGVTSSGEYMDITVNSSKSSAESISSINEQLVEGLCVTGYRLLPEGAQNAMASVAAADYTIVGKKSFTSLYSFARISDDKERWFDKQPSIIVEKPTKRGSVTVDLKKLIYSFDFYKEENYPAARLFLAQGSENSIKPDFVIERFCEYINLPYDILDLNIHKNDMYAGTPGSFVSLSEAGEDIV